MSQGAFSNEFPPGTALASFNHASTKGFVMPLSSILSVLVALIGTIAPTQNAFASEELDRLLNCAKAITSAEDDSSVQIQSRLFENSKIGQVLTETSSSSHLFVRVVERNSSFSRFGFLSSKGKSISLKEFNGSQTAYDPDETANIEVFHSLADAIFAQTRSAIDSGNTGIIGLVREGNKTNWLFGEVKSMSANGILVSDVNGKDQVIKPSQFVIEPSQQSYLKIGLLKLISLHTYLDYINLKGISVRITYFKGLETITSGPLQVTAVTDIETEKLKDNVVLDSMDGLFRTPKQMGIVVQSKEPPFSWSLPLTSIKSVDGPVFSN